MNLKKEFEKKFVGIIYDTGDIWDWIEEKFGSQNEAVVKPKIANLNKEIRKASQTGILITRNITDLGSVHLNASLDEKFIALDVLQDILDNNLHSV